MHRDDLHHINQRLLYTHPPQKSDVAILLGNAMCSGDIARKTAEAYDEGHFSKIILCGGVPQKTWTLLHRRLNNVFNREASHSGLKLSIPLGDIFTTATEAKHMESILKKRGVPEAAIVHIDTASKNTGENFSFIRQHINETSYQSATILCAVFHQRRAMETAKKWFPDLKTTTIPVYPYGITPKDWHEKWPLIPFARAAMLGEHMRINPENPDNYYNKGFCVPVDTVEANDNRHIIAPSRQSVRTMTA